MIEADRPKTKVKKRLDHPSAHLELGPRLNDRDLRRSVIAAVCRYQKSTAAVVWIVVSGCGFRPVRDVTVMIAAS